MTTRITNGLAHLYPGSFLNDSFNSCNDGTNDNSDHHRETAKIMMIDLFIFIHMRASAAVVVV